MPNRLADTFQNARANGRKLLCPFLTAGYPSLDATVELLRAAQRVNEKTGNSIGCVELGIPFSDPIADGPTIQASYTHALNHGVTLAGALDCVARARAAGVTLPIVLMVSISVVFRKGPKEFAAAAQRAGIDGIIPPDVPLEEAPDVAAVMQAAGLRTCLLVAPSTPPERRTQIAKLCNGFVYYLSLAGITGERKELPPDLAANVTDLRQHADVPICVGFGISTAAHVRQVLQVADGAIVGSALVRHITDHLREPLPQLTAHFESLLTELAQGTKP